jgi:hypothetical protein
MNGNWHSRPVNKDELMPTTSDKVVFGVVIGAWVVVGILFVYGVI